MSFLDLEVVPSLKVTGVGLAHVERFEVPPFFIAH